MTAQVHERLLLDGAWTSMAASPRLPSGHPRVRKASEEARRKASFIVNTTACWRGYVGTWEIKDEKLYLIGIEGQYELIGLEPLFANWVSEVVRVPSAEVIEYVHLGFASLFAEELLISIDHGAVTERRKIDNRGKPLDEQRRLIRGLMGEGATGAP